ncbi:MAG: ribonuclease E/G [Lachnospiraceae bacterium]|nr:ribonuclease E/G [Lachnospiraceae bacterium]
MNGKLLFTKVNTKRCVALIQDGKLMAASFQGEKEKVTGGIYVARIRDVVKDLNACFAEIDKDLICFLPGLVNQSPMFLSGNSLDTIGKPRQIKQGDLILVQGLREAQKTKQPAVTTKISISNRFFVLALGSNRTNFSTKLPAQRKNEIRDEVCTGRLFDENGNLKPWTEMQEGRSEFLPFMPPVGLIVRTECNDVPTQVLRGALEGLMEEFFQLLNSAFYRSALTCLRMPPSPWQDAINHFVLPSEYQEIVTDDKELFDEINESQLLPNGKNLRLYEDLNYPLEKLYSLTTKLEGALMTRVWLKSGAYLIIEPTEALTVIDVNSGKYEAHKGDQYFYRAINMEAAQEIAYQIRLRNLSGMILIDFINMLDPKDQEDLIKEMERLLQKDRVKTCVVDFTRLGLMEITRMKTVPPLHEQARRYKYPLPRNCRG